MAAIVRIPKLGMAMAEGVLVEWLVEDGASVQPTTAIYRLETDKVENDIEAGSAGRIRLLVVAGETYAVGTPVARID